MIIESIILAIGIIIAAKCIAGAIENVACDLAEDFFTRVDLLMPLPDDED